MKKTGFKDKLLKYLKLLSYGSILYTQICPASLGLIPMATSLWQNSSVQVSKQNRQQHRVGGNIGKFSKFAILI